MPKIYLVCTGLGVVQRGFESYMYSLATKLKEAKFDFILFSGGKPDQEISFWKRIASIHRKNKVVNLIFGSRIASEIELTTFFFSLCFQIFRNQPSVIYLGEYKLYCYLFKLRAAFRLKYSLTLYTGGQVIPGIFDINKDFVHHVTDIYVNELCKNGFPKNRQFLLPHFISEYSKIDSNLIKAVREKAYPKKIILSVGLIDKDIKRMNLLISVLASYKEMFFPIILGEATNQTDAIVAEAINAFGDDKFIIKTVPRQDLMSYYYAADAFVLLSPKESFGLVYLEALEAGLPVIACDFHESRFVLRENVRYIVYDRLAELPEILNEIIETNNETLKADRKKFVTNNYTWKVLKQAYLEMFDKISRVHSNV